jgi:hypothetical protein
MGAQASDALARGENETALSLDREGMIAHLKACQARLEISHPFKKGQLVVWKKGLKNKRTPAYGQPIIVTEVLPTPLFDEERGDSGSRHFKERLTLKAGEIDLEGEFSCYFYDSRRLAPYVE